MSIDNLFRQLKDIQFQADKLLKSEKIEEEAIRKFANYSNELKSNLIDLDLNDELLLHVNDIEEINTELNPSPPMVTALMSALSFGAANKSYRRKKREAYFRENVKNIKERYVYIDLLLKEI